MNKTASDIDLTEIYLIGSINGINTLIEKYPLQRELIFSQLVTHKKIICLCNDHVDVKKALSIFSDKKDIIFDQLYNANKLLHIASDARSLNFLIDLFRDKKLLIANLYFSSNNLLFNGPDQNHGFSNCIEFMIKHLPEKKLFILENLITSQQKKDLELMPFDIDVLVSLFPENKEVILNEFVINSNKADDYYDKFSYLNQLIELFQNHSEIIFNRFNVKIIHPSLFSPKQYGPTCGFVALSIITKYLSIIENNKNLFFPVKNDPSSINEGLRKIGKKIADIQGPGAIFSLSLFLKLIRGINLCGEALHIPQQQELIKTICLLIDLKIPVILPYDKESNGGDNAHYAVICGYQLSKGNINFLITHYNRYEFLSADTLFQLNDDLHACHPETYVKDKKNSSYRKMSDLLNKGAYYKSYTYPTINLKNTLRNHFLIVLTPQMRITLEQTGALNQLNKFIEANPRNIEYIQDQENNEDDYILDGSQDDQDEIDLILTNTEYLFSIPESDENDDEINLVLEYTDSFLFNPIELDKDQNLSPYNNDNDNDNGSIDDIIIDML